MDEEQFGTTADYLRAFEAIRTEGIPDHHDRLLRAHLAAPGYATTWAQLAEGSPLSAQAGFEQSDQTYPFGCHVAVAEVDVETGEARLVRHIAVDDCGTVLNQMLVDGQVHGGVAQGVAQALYEEFVYDAHGNPLTATFDATATFEGGEKPAKKPGRRRTAAKPGPQEEGGEKAEGDTPEEGGLF